MRNVNGDAVLSTVFPDVDEWYTNLVWAFGEDAPAVYSERVRQVLADLITEYPDTDWSDAPTAVELLDLRYAAPVFETRDHPRLPNLEPYQFHAMVGLTGYTQDILGAISSDTDPMFAAAALAKYQYSTYYKRDDPFVIALSNAVGLTAGELDTIWLNAAEF